MLHNGCDQSNEKENNDSVVGYEEIMHHPVPAKFWMACSENSLGKEDVDDDYDDHTGIDENVRRNGDRNVVLMCTPY